MTRTFAREPATRRGAARLWLLALAALLLVACAGTPTTGSVDTVESAPAEAAPAEAAPTEAAAEDAVAESAPAEGAALSGTHTYVIVPEESEARYLATEEFFADALDKLGIDAGFGEAVGTTQEIEGQLTLNLDNLADALGENSFTVRMDTLVTGRDMRDNWIRTDGPRFNEFPTATFTANAIEGAPAAYTAGEEVSFQLAGDLTVRDVTQPVTFDVTARIEGDTLTGTAGTRLLMSDFGIEPPSFANTLTVDDEFGIEVDFTAREQ